MPLPRWLAPLLAVVALVLLAQGQLVTLLVDWLWFQSLGLEQIFVVSTVARVGLWALGFIGAFVIIGINARWALSRAPFNYMRLAMLLAELGLTPAQLGRMVNGIVLAAVVLPSLLFGAVASARWMEVLAAANAVPFGETDPIFGLDIGFYFFTLPVLELVQSWFTGVLTVCLLPVLAIYLGRELILQQETTPQLKGPGRAHILFLGALLFLTMAAGYVLDRFDLLFTQNGVVHGIGYADLSARLPALWIMAAASVAVAVALVAARFRDGWRIPIVAGATWLVASVVVNGAMPGAVQTYIVGPNELELEREFLSHNIQATRSAYALDRIEVQPYEAATGLSTKDLEENPLTIDNVRLWDTRPLLTTYKQLQEIRLYYDFVDVDVDRYTVDGALRQVMLSAREFNFNNVPENAKSWVNKHLQYTHGYGLTMSPVNVITEEGLPELWVQDIPPKASIDLPIDRPEIYYGELTDNYVFVGTSTEEFDYPTGDDNKYTSFEGEGGVSVGSMAHRLLLSLYLGEFDLLLSQYIQTDSKVLLHRRIKDRVRRIAPFMQYDHDPYLVVADGQLYWMLDAYTWSDRYPYSEPMRMGRGQSFNYIRNSVKVVIDAYNGDVSFYVSDPTDPLVQVYEGVFPGTFQPLEEMPASLHAHMRYPSDFFDVQARLYRAYHMLDETVFFNKEDMWEVPKELYGGQEQPMESYYLIMKLPGEQRAEFILLLPFTPTGKDNMISWLAARSDGEHYGKLILYQFPKQKLVYGPMQIEARINQDPVISEQITLWSQGGSRVNRGNLLVIPIGDSLMYVEPLYLEADNGQLPQLKRVIVSYENKLAMRQTLDEALLAVFGGGEAPNRADRQAARDRGQAFVPAQEAGPTVGAGAGWAALVLQANKQLDRANEAQRQGDWAGYGRALASLEQTMADLAGLAGGPIPEVAPEVAPEVEVPAPEEASP